MLDKLKALAQWFEERLHIQKLFEATAGHKVPASTNSWFYVFGSAALSRSAPSENTRMVIAFRPATRTQITVNSSHSFFQSGIQRGCIQAPR